MIAADVAQRLAQVLSKRCIKNVLGRMIDRAQHAVAIQSEHAGRQALRARRSIRALIFGFLRAVTKPRTGQFEFSLHLVERVQQKAQFVRHAPPAAACRSGPHRRRVSPWPGRPIGAVNRSATPNAASKANSTESKSTKVSTKVKVSLSEPRRYFRRWKSKLACSTPVGQCCTRAGTG